MGFADEPGAVLPGGACRSGIPASQRRRAGDGPGGLSQLLPRCAGPSGRHGQRVPRRQVQEFRRAVRGQRAVARCAGGRRLLAERRVGHVHAAGRAGAQAAGGRAGPVDRRSAAAPAGRGRRPGRAGADQEKLVDGLMTRDELRALLTKRGAADPDNKSFRQVSLQDYRSALPETGDRDNQVAVIVAQGEIMDGEAPQGVIGGVSTAELIRRASDDDTVKALVLRVDSPGGSAFGAELIRRELENTRKAGKPVVVSMSDVAASGGYWIATSADAVLADPATVTGSIGVFGMLPTFDKTIDKLGIHTGGVTTTWLAGAGDVRRPLDPRLGQVIQSTVGHIYRDFLARTAASRHRTVEEVEVVAQGRVWTGRQAHDRRLVDGFGGLAAAVKDAAERARLAAGYRTTYFELEPKGLNRLLDILAERVARAAVRAAGPLPQWLHALSSSGPVGADLGRVLTEPVTPRSVLAHCLCQAP